MLPLQRRTAGLARKTVVAAGANVAGFLLGIAVSIVLTRALGPELRGVYFLLVSTNVVLTAVAGLGVSSACATLVARGRFSFAELNGAAMLLALAAGCSAFVATTVAFPLVDDSLFDGVPYRYLAVATALVAITSYQQHWNALMIGLGQIERLSAVGLGITFAYSLLVAAVLGVLGFELGGFVAIWAATLLAGASVMVGLSPRAGPVVSRPRRSTLGAVLRFGLRTSWGSIARELLLRLDVYVVNLLAGTRSVGYYSLSASLVQRLWIPANALATASTSEVARRTRPEAATLTAALARAALLLTAVAALVAALVAPWLVPVAYGDAFAESVEPLLVLLPGAVCFSGAVLVQNFLVVRLERPGVVSAVYWTLLIASIPVYLLLAGAYGITGAALAASLTYLGLFGVTMLAAARFGGLSATKPYAFRVSDLRYGASALRSAFRRIPAGEQRPELRA